MTDPIYRKEVLRLAADASGAGRLAPPAVSGVAHNPACGDRVTVDLILADGSIHAVGHDTKACVLSQASASILGATLRGKTEHDVQALLADVRAMLEHGIVPPPPFEAYSALAGVAEFRTRHRCVTLPIEAVLAALRSSDRSEEGAERT